MINQKISIIKREKLNDDLSHALKKNKIVYIGCHTGWGKTTAILSWLENIGASYVYATARDDDFFEKLKSSEFKKAKLVVLDDLYLLNETEDINSLVDQIATANSKFVLISRTTLPSFFKPFSITHQLEAFGMEDFAFSQDEIKELLELTGCNSIDKVCNGTVKFMGGWPLAVSLLAKRLVNEEYTENTLDLIKWDVFDYFDATLLGRWDTKFQDFLLDICELEDFSVKLACMVTGKRNADEYLKKALSIGSFLNFTPPDSYTFIWLFREYLLKKRHEICSETHIMQLYQNTGLYYELEDDLPSAMNYYSKAGNVDKLSVLLIENSNRNASNAQFYETEKYYRSLPENIVLSSPELMSAMSMMESLCCHPEESEKWFDRLEQYKKFIDKNTISYKTAKEKLLYLSISLPHRGSMNVFDLLRNATEICTSGKLVLQDTSITGDMPSLMNGGKDFTEWTKKDRKIYPLLKMSMEVVFGKCGVGLADGSMGENLLEKSETLNFTDALSYLNNALSEAMFKGTMQMQFAIIGITARAFIAEGSLDTAKSLIENFKARCITEKANTFLPNIKAVLTRMNMLAGNQYETEQWMKSEAPDELNTFYVLSRYQYLTKVRGYLLNERYLEAASLLNLLKKYYERYGRPYGLMESQLLYAITLYRMHDERYKEEMTAVVKKCEDYKFFRLIADEGIAAFELLKKLNYDGDKKYFNTLLDITREQAMRYPNYLVPKKKLKNELSSPEKAVLQLIVQGKRNNEIADFLGVTVSTVKFHTTNIYAKLEVTSRSQAIKVTTELGLL